MRYSTRIIALSAPGRQMRHALRPKICWDIRPTALCSVPVFSACLRVFGAPAGPPVGRHCLLLERACAVWTHVGVPARGSPVRAVSPAWRGALRWAGPSYIVCLCLGTLSAVLFWLARGSASSFHRLPLSRAQSIIPRHAVLSSLHRDAGQIIISCCCWYFSAQGPRRSILLRHAAHKWYMHTESS